MEEGQEIVYFKTVNIDLEMSFAEVFNLVPAYEWNVFFFFFLVQVSISCDLPKGHKAANNP